MATIRPNDNAPADSVKYIFPTATFDLAPDGSYESEDRNVLASAEAHPWLEVEYPEVTDLAESRLGHVPVEEDVLAAGNSLAFDPDAIRAVEEAKAEVDESRLAVDAGLDQGEATEVAGGVAVTLAADETSDEPEEGDE